MKKYIFCFMIIVVLAAVFVPVQVNAEGWPSEGHSELRSGEGDLFGFVKKLTSFGNQYEYKHHEKRSSRVSLKASPPLSHEAVASLVDENIRAFKEVYWDDLRSMDGTLPDAERQEKDFSRIEEELSVYGTMAFVAGAEEQYEKSCINCGSSYMDVDLKWDIKMDVRENTGDRIVVESAEFKGFMKYGSFVEVTLTKEDLQWKIAGIEYTPFSEDNHLDLSKDEAKAAVLENENIDNAAYMETTSRRITDSYGYPYHSNVHLFSVNDGEYDVEVDASNGEQREVLD